MYFYSFLVSLLGLETFMIFLALSPYYRFISAQEYDLHEENKVFASIIPSYKTAFKTVHSLIWK